MPPQEEAPCMTALLVLLVAHHLMLEIFLAVVVMFAMSMWVPVFCVPTAQTSTIIMWITGGNHAK